MLVFHVHERNDCLVQAWYFGMALFNLMLFVGLKDRICLRYVLFVIFVVLTIASKRRQGVGVPVAWHVGLDERFLLCVRDGLTGIAPATDRVEAENLVRKICEAVLALAIPHQEIPLGRVTMSCGVAVRVPGWGRDLPRATHRTGRCGGLYRAKVVQRQRALVVVVSNPIWRDSGPMPLRCASHAKNRCRGWRSAWL